MFDKIIILQLVIFGTKKFCVVFFIIASNMHMWACMGMVSVCVFRCWCIYFFNKIKMHKNLWELGRKNKYYYKVMLTRYTGFYFFSGNWGEKYEGCHSCFELQSFRSFREKIYPSGYIWKIEDFRSKFCFAKHLNVSNFRRLNMRSMTYVQWPS